MRRFAFPSATSAIAIALLCITPLVARAGQDAAASAALSSAPAFDPLDYAGLFILLFLIFGLLAWRLWRRNEDQRDAL
jgi:hypothetical protein